MIAATIAMLLVHDASQPRKLTFDDAVHAALATDPSIEKSRVEQERARLGVLVANLERIHASVDASVEELYAGASSPFFAPPAKDPLTGASLPPWQNGVLGLANVQASAQAPLFSGFRVESDIARAEDLERASTFDLKAAQRSVAIAVADAYFSARRLELLEKAQAESEARLEESERVVTARLNAGLAAGLDKNRASSRRAQLDVERSQLLSQDREARVKLATVLGIDEPVELVDDPPAVAGDIGDVDALVSRALDARPELKAAEWRAASVDEEKRAAESAFWPQLGAGVLAEVGNNPQIAGAGNRAVAGAAIPFAGSVFDLQAGLTLSINLFDTWTTTHNIEDASHRRRIADADTRALRRQVENDVRLAHAHIVNIRTQIDALEKARAIEADNVAILQHAYERGEVLLTELLDEQLRLADFERQIVDLKAQLAVAKIELDSATGSFEVSP